MRRLLLSLVALGASLALYAQQPYPELGAKLDQYFLALAGEPVAVQNEECDFLIETCQDSLVRQYTALKIYDHYLKSKIMGDDAVAVHVAREWFLSGKVKMKSEEDAFHAQLFVQFNENSLIGSQAPVLTLFAPDSTRQYVPQKGGYSVLYFYDAGCATCKRETPKLLGLTESGKYPITVYAIYVGASKEEWEVLLNAVGGEDNAGTKLKSSTDWLNGGNGLDSYGFNALPAGMRYETLGSDDMGEDAEFVTSSEYVSSGLYYDQYVAHFYDSATWVTIQFSGKNYGYSVRCVQN